MHLPDIESFWLRVKHKHFNIYIIIPTDNFRNKIYQKFNFEEKACQKTIESFFLITRAWSWGSFVKLGLSIKVLATR